MIRDQIVEKCHSNELSWSLFTQTDLTLDRMLGLRIGTNMQSVIQQIWQTEKSNKVVYIDISQSQSRNFTSTQRFHIQLQLTKNVLNVWKYDIKHVSRIVLPQRQSVEHVAFWVILWRSAGESPKREEASPQSKVRNVDSSQSEEGDITFALNSNDNNGKVTVEDGNVDLEMLID